MLAVQSLDSLPFQAPSVPMSNLGNMTPDLGDILEAPKLGIMSHQSAIILPHVNESRTHTSIELDIFYPALCVLVYVNKSRT